MVVGHALGVIHTQLVSDRGAVWVIRKAGSLAEKKKRGQKGGEGERAAAVGAPTQQALITYILP